MSGRTKAAIASLGALPLAIVAAAVATPDASRDGASDSPALSVPRGPVVAFCPTRAQTEAHLKAYGFDYKPTVLCTSDGAVQGASPRALDPVQRRASRTARLKRLKERMLRARPIPDPSGRGCEIVGELPDGERIKIEPIVCQPGVDIRELARKALP